MDLAKLKAYAPKARQDFLQAVTDRAAHYGIKQEGAEVSVLPVVEKGDGVVIGGRPFPRKVGEQRRALEKRIREHGFAQTIEALAYTWFNRLVAIRFMEAHNYLDHGFRVLSPAPHHADGRGERLPEILEQAEHVSLPGLSKQTVIDLKIDGTKDAQLYRLLVVAQCNALNSIMPFIFPMIDDETELVLPDNLLHSDSLVRSLAREITDEDCASVEILGWLYQFYIAEKKDAVMARKSAVPTEDIPSVTQLFTPHWIVRYLVENSLGRLWLLNRPGSRLREQMPYYIEGEAETDFLRIAKPEDIRVLDPAVGSGHMLTYAFDLLFAIYVEEGYAPAEVPALILRHNLHGLDICPRAAQLAGLALVLKAREKARRFFQSDKLVQPRILSLQDVSFGEGELREYIRALSLSDALDEPMLSQLRQFEEASTFGSLIQPILDQKTIAAVRSVIETKDLGGQLFLRATHRQLLRVLAQAQMLSPRYHIVVANPPYMGFKQMNTSLRRFGETELAESARDLFSMFIQRNTRLTVTGGIVAMVTMDSWMYGDDHTSFREWLLSSKSIAVMAHLGPHAFDTIGGEVVQVTAFVLAPTCQPDRLAEYDRLVAEAPSSAKEAALLSRTHRFRACTRSFLRVPRQILAYHATEHTLEAFASGRPLREFAEAFTGLQTGDNPRFIRYWYEVDKAHILFGCTTRKDAERSGARWFPYVKGSDFRRWYGNNVCVVNWQHDGAEIRQHSGARPQNCDYYFRPGLAYNNIANAFSVRAVDAGFIFDQKNSMFFSSAPEQSELALGLLNSPVVGPFLEILSPKDFNPGSLRLIPVPPSALQRESLRSTIQQLISLARADWDRLETSWDFSDQPLLRHGLKGTTLEASWQNWEAHGTAAIRQMQSLETQNNRHFIEAYGLVTECTPEVLERDISLARPDVRKDVAALLSYAVGCMMGRYSLDKPGLILANAGDTLTEYRSKVGRPLDSLTFAPDEDGIVPVLDREWFEDDIVARAREFLRATFGEASLEADLRFIEAGLGKELRKYFLSDFFKDHRQTYKKRPIYWLFSSGKQRAFQCLVYLHRYNEGTLSRMRTEYVVPLQGRIASLIEQLEGDKARATSTSHRKKVQKEQDLLKKQQTELLAFDEKLNHAAGQKISLNLDDGVKVNYGKFGDLLADVDAVTGGADE